MLTARNARPATLYLIVAGPYAGFNCIDPLTVNVSGWWSVRLLPANVRRDVRAVYIQEVR